MAEYVRVYKQVDGTWTWVTELESGAGGDVTAADVDSTPATNGQVLTADGAGGADWEDSGGSLPVTQERFYGFTDVGHVSGAMPWVHASGDNLLDLTDPLRPLFVEEGTYVLSMTASLFAATGTYIILDCELDAAGEDYDQRTAAPLVADNATYNGVGVSICAVVAAGADLVASSYLDVVGGASVGLRGQIVKLG